ncbi:DEAD/DEAH box helicase [Clostridium beijerinckii]|uniref:DEAD/DEAH box helicase n=1 Tax=Clostridium beijerinckii TaxID=1520 RepID=UPI00243270DC|nr:DEAD/DEAH box helicase [Clostridium beijerinckii]MDG5856895.1 DEAD/DEAH box helicase [Clostridium beijerinckii]
MNISDLIIYNKTMPKREAAYVDYPSNLSEELCEYLSKNGIDKLYSHQAEMFEKARDRNNIVITTSTASGKTLSFLLPVIQEILSNPLARAIFIYPTKALASDQYRAILPYLEYFGANRISAGVYDGDTPVNERSRIRKNANIILTNPEMINAAFLPNHSKFGFDFIFSNLKYIVIDELHTYRGAFGSHLANVFRRLGRVCRYYNSSPQYLCSSATIANPVELAEEICGHKFLEVCMDGSPAPKKNYKLVQPPKIMGNDKKYYGQVQSTSVAADLIPDLVENDNSFIAFAKSRRNVEVILKEARDKLETEVFFGGSLKDKISGYRGGYTPLERKEIENKMINGVLRGLISTNALELGIDIGKIDTTVIVGYPGTRASFWQQSGRAGRSGIESTNYLIFENLPFDQYIAINPDWLFENGSENAVIDKNNLLIELAHIRAAAAEIPLTLDDISIFPDLGETIPVLIRASELTNQSGKFAWCGNSFPAGDFSLRNIDKARYKLINKDNNKEITEMDEMQAFREIHNGAIYMHDGVQYQVIKLDLESRTAFAIPFNGNYYTMPGGTTNIRIIQGTKDMEYERTKVTFGDVNVDEIVYMYKKLQFHNHQNLGFEQLEKPLSKDYDTESTWIKIPDNVVTVYRRLLQESQNGNFIRNNHFEGVCYAIKNAAMMATMTEQEDIGVVMSNNAIEISQNYDSEVYMFIYDKYVGGLGYSEKVFDLTANIIENAIKMVGGCTCDDGCAACIGDYQLNKAMVLWGLKNLLEEIEAPKDIKLAQYAPATFIKKAFKFNELQEKWKEFCEYMQENGDAFAKFLSTIPKVEIDNRTLILVLNNAFYREWVMEESNKKSIINIISFHTDAPMGIELSVRLEEIDEDRKNVKSKLQRRYEDLTE